MELLLDYCQVDPTMSGADGKTPLDLALESNNISAINLLFRQAEKEGLGPSWDNLYS